MPFVLLYVVLEVAAIAALVAWIGLGWTLLVLLAGSVLGLLLARSEGARAARALATAMQRGRLAHEEATDGLLIAIGGVLIFLPGLISDVLGLALVFPPTRGIARRRMVRAAERAAPGLRTARIRYGATVVDGEAVTEPRPGSSPSGQPPLITGSGVSGAAGPAGRERPGPGGGGPVVDGEVVDDPDRRDR
ncbi:FxsA family protein [Pseudonocardia sp. C8]|nr:FxsA family protein [Pseudonocardia sp. C8]MBC3194599.1 FxsA family protein [Pseudonocardia sp. C8]